MHVQRAIKAAVQKVRLNKRVTLHIIFLKLPKLLSLRATVLFPVDLSRASEKPAFASYGAAVFAGASERPAFAKATAVFA